VSTPSKFLLCLVGVAVAAVSTAHGAQPLPTSAAQPNALYLTGGVDQDEFAQLTEQGAGYNVKVLFAERSGSFIADVKVTITGSNGNVVLQVASGGPLLFARLAAGNYELKATHEGVSQVRRLAIGTKGRSEITLRW